MGFHPHARVVEEDWTHKGSGDKHEDGDGDGEPKKKKCACKGKWSVYGGCMSQ